MTIELIEYGNIATPKGFIAGGIKAGIKSTDAYDLGILLSYSPCKVAGVFTKNYIKAPSVIYSQKVIKSGYAQAIIANSGCANACTGNQGMKDVKTTAKLTAEKFKIPETSVLVASTGVIGKKLPMSRISQGIKNISLGENDGHIFGQAIMTTDTLVKEIAVNVKDDTGSYIISGVAKGSGMIHPEMATMLAFLTTDALVSEPLLHNALNDAVNDSFNMTSVDGDTSTNDMVIILSNGLAGNKTINSKNGAIFIEAVNKVCKFLARSIAEDGEGATKLIEVTVKGARDKADARLIARAVTSSALVKTAIHGNDPNWGRVIAAAGRSGAIINETKVDLYLNKQCVFRKGTPQVFDKSALSNMMAKEKTIAIDLDLNSGKGNAIAWGCDLSIEYVTINSAYTT